MKSHSSGEKSPSVVCSTGSLSFRILSINNKVDCASYGKTKVANSYTINPSAHISAGYEYSFVEILSGDL